MEDSIGSSDSHVLLLSMDLTTNAWIFNSIITPNKKPERNAANRARAIGRGPRERDDY